MNRNSPEYLPPSERAALTQLFAWRDADLAAHLGISEDTLRRALSMPPDGRPGRIDLTRARVPYLGDTRLWNPNDVRIILATGGLPFCTSRISRAADAVAG